MMRYCYECGAQVANEDAFCAFCGISLEPLPVAQDEPSAVVENKEPQIVTAAENSFSNQPFEADQQLPATLAGEVFPSERLKAEPLSEELPPTPVSEIFEDEPLDPLPAVVAKNETSDIAPNFLQTSEPAKEFSAPQIIEEKAPSASLQNENEPILDESQMATIPNFAPGQFALDSEMPIEEIRQEDQPTLISGSLPNYIAENKPQSQKLADEPVDLALDRLTAQEEQFNPQAVSERQSWEQMEKEAESQQFKDYGSPVSEQNVLSQSEPFGANPDFPQNQTPEISAPVSGFVASNPVLNEARAINDPVIEEKNQIVASTPRPTEANQPQDTPGGKSPKLKPLEDGTVLHNRYEIIRRIGGGGMGAVYLANDRNLGGVMRAVKEMIQAYVDEAQQEKAVQDFRRESLMLTSLEHPAIPTIYDYFYDETAGRFYLVMKYISGGDLAGKLRSAPEAKLDEQSVSQWAMQVADVLDYLHNHQPPIVYRDLKPSNIMLDGNSNKVFLIDFGIARTVNKEEKGVTAVGTMGYAPPELFAGNAEPRSDIYSLGATMFHLLTGSDPQNNPLLIFDFTKNARPRQINPEMSVEMEQIVMRAVEYNANMRFASAAEMRDALRSHLERLRAGQATYRQPSDLQPVTTPVTVAPQAGTGTVFCGYCGERIVATDMFCAYCGSKQAEAARIQAAAKEAFPSGRITAKLVIETGAFDAPAFVLEKETNLVGREDRRSNIFPEVDLTRFDAQSKISRRHARIWRQGANFMIEDLGSANGTVLLSSDNKSVKLQAHQPHALTHGDRLRLGETTLHFLVN